MAVDPFTIAAVTAGAGLVGQGINAISQGSINKKTRQYNREMYAQQRKDAISDFNMQNAYNSPQAQMERLKSAGLNPNLVYGATAPGNSSGQIHSATPQGWSPKAPQFDLGSPMAQYFSIATQSAQLDNLQAINDKIKAETALIASRGTLTSAEASYADSLASSKANLASSKAGTANLDYYIKEATYQLEANAKAEGYKTSEKESMEKFTRVARMLDLDERIKRGIAEGKGLDNTLKSLDVDLKKNGINPNDPIVLRILGRFVGGILSLSEWSSKFKF